MGRAQLLGRFVPAAFPAQPLPVEQVAAGDLVVVLEAMKMENPVTAHKDGTITGLAVEAGAAITQGTVLAEIK